MRAIKFRAWDKDKKLMMRVSDISFGDDGLALTVVFQTSPKGEYYHGLVNGENGELMQFTGLKDRHDEDIYEGDIVTCEGFGGSYIVEYQGCMFEGKHIESSNTFPVDLEMQNLTIIGNIYENPDLVK